MTIVKLNKLMCNTHTLILLEAQGESRRKTFQWEISLGYSQWKINPERVSTFSTHLPSTRVY